MPMILLGLGYLLLAAAGAACWGLALAGSRRGAGRPHTGPRACSSRAGSRPWPRGQWWCGSSPCRIRGSRRRRRSWGCRSARSTSIFAAIVWWMPRHGAPVSARRDGITAGAFAAAAAAAAAEVILTIAVGAPAGARRRRGRARRRGGGRGRDGVRPHPGLGRIPATGLRGGSGIRRRDRRRRASSRS